MEGAYGVVPERPCHPYWEPGNGLDTPARPLNKVQVASQRQQWQ